MLQRYLGRRPSFVDGELYASSENLRSESLPLAAWHQPSEVSCRGDSADLVCKHLGKARAVRRCPSLRDR